MPGFLDLLQGDSLDDVGVFLESRDSDEKSSGKYLAGNLKDLRRHYLTAASILHGDDVTIEYAGVVVFDEEVMALNDDAALNYRTPAERQRNISNEDECEEKSDTVIRFGFDPINEDVLKDAEKQRKNYNNHVRKPTQNLQTACRGKTQFLKEEEIAQVKAGYDRTVVETLRKKKIARISEARSGPFSTTVNEDGDIVLDIDLTFGEGSKLGEMKRIFELHRKEKGFKPLIKQVNDKLENAGNQRCGKEELTNDSKGYHACKVNGHRKDPLSNINSTGTNNYEAKSVGLRPQKRTTVNVETSKVNGLSGDSEQTPDKNTEKSRKIPSSSRDFAQDCTKTQRTSNMQTQKTKTSTQNSSLPRTRLCKNVTNSKTCANSTRNVTNDLARQSNRKKFTTKNMSKTQATTVVSKYGNKLPENGVKRSSRLKSTQDTAQKSSSEFENLKKHFRTKEISVKCEPIELIVTDSLVHDNLSPENTDHCVRRSSRKRRSTEKSLWLENKKKTLNSRGNGKNEVHDFSNAKTAKTSSECLTEKRSSLRVGNGTATPTKQRAKRKDSKVSPSSEHVASEVTSMKNRQMASERDRRKKNPGQPPKRKRKNGTEASPSTKETSGKESEKSNSSQKRTKNKTENTNAAMSADTDTLSLSKDSVNAENGGGSSDSDVEGEVTDRFTVKDMATLKYLIILASDGSILMDDPVIIKEELVSGEWKDEFLGSSVEIGPSDDSTELESDQNLAVCNSGGAAGQDPTHQPVEGDLWQQYISTASALLGYGDELARAVDFSQTPVKTEPPGQNHDQLFQVASDGYENFTSRDLRDIETEEEEQGQGTIGEKVVKIQHGLSDNVSTAADDDVDVLSEDEMPRLQDFLSCSRCRPMADVLRAFRNNDFGILFVDVENKSENKLEQPEGQAQEDSSGMGKVAKKRAITKSNKSKIIASKVRCVTVDYNQLTGDTSGDCAATTQQYLKTDVSSVTRKASTKRPLLKSKSHSTTNPKLGTTENEHDLRDIIDLFVETSDKPRRTERSDTSRSMALCKSLIAAERTSRNRRNRTRKSSSHNNNGVVKFIPKNGSSGRALWKSQHIKLKKRRPVNGACESDYGTTYCPPENNNFKCNSKSKALVRSRNSPQNSASEISEDINNNRYFDKETEENCASKRPRSEIQNSGIVVSENLDRYFSEDTLENWALKRREKKLQNSSSKKSENLNLNSSSSRTTGTSDDAATFPCSAVGNDTSQGEDSQSVELPRLEVISSCSRCLPMANVIRAPPPKIVFFNKPIKKHDGPSKLSLENLLNTTGPALTLLEPCEVSRSDRWSSYEYANCGWRHTREGNCVRYRNDSRTSDPAFPEDESCLEVINIYDLNDIIASRNRHHKTKKSTSKTNVPIVDEVSRRDLGDLGNDLEQPCQQKSIKTSVKIRPPAPQISKQKGRETSGTDACTGRRQKSLMGKDTLAVSSSEGVTTGDTSRTDESNLQTPMLPKKSRKKKQNDILSLSYECEITEDKARAMKQNPQTPNRAGRIEVTKELKIPHADHSAKLCDPVVILEDFQKAGLSPDKRDGNSKKCKVTSKIHGGQSSSETANHQDKNTQFSEHYTVTCSPRNAGDATEKCPQTSLLKTKFPRSVHRSNSILKKGKNRYNYGVTFSSSGSVTFKMVRDGQGDIIVGVDEAQSGNASS